MNGKEKKREIFHNLYTKVEEMSEDIVQLREKIKCLELENLKLSNIIKLQALPDLRTTVTFVKSAEIQRVKKFSSIDPALQKPRRKELKQQTNGLSLKEKRKLAAKRASKNVARG